LSSFGVDLRTRVSARARACLRAQMPDAVYRFLILDIHQAVTQPV
jgi:hypothetical protein